MGSHATYDRLTLVVLHRYAGVLRVDCCQGGEDYHLERTHGRLRNGEVRSWHKGAGPPRDPPWYSVPWQVTQHGIKRGRPWKQQLPTGAKGTGTFLEVI